MEFIQGGNHNLWLLEPPEERTTGLPHYYIDENFRKLDVAATDLTDALANYLPLTGGIVTGEIRTDVPAGTPPTDWMRRIVNSSGETVFGVLADGTVYSQNVDDLMLCIDHTEAIPAAVYMPARRFSRKLTIESWSLIASASGDITLRVSVSADGLTGWTTLFDAALTAQQVNSGSGTWVVSAGSYVRIEVLAGATVNVVSLNYSGRRD